MADIRQGGLIDRTDQRPPENPLSYNGQWLRYGPWNDYLQLHPSLGNIPSITLADLSVGHRQNAYSYWAPQTWDDDVEIWASCSVIFGMDDGASISLGLVSSAGGYGSDYSGYTARCVNTFSFGGWQLYKITSGSGSLLASTTSGMLTHQDMALFRRSGNNLQIYTSTDDGASWTQRISYSDTTYTQDMHVSLGSSVALVADYPGWYNIGAGQRNRQQIYRYVSN